MHILLRSDVRWALEEFVSLNKGSLVFFVTASAILTELPLEGVEEGVLILPLLHALLQKCVILPRD